MSVALEIPALSAACRVSRPSQIQTTQSTTNPVQVSPYPRSTVFVRCARTAFAARYRVETAFAAGRFTDRSPTCANMACSISASL